MFPKPWDKTEAQELLAKGWSYSRLASMYGSTTTTVRCWLDAEYAAHCRNRINTARRIRTSNEDHVVEIRYRRPPEQDVAARLAEIPPDTRTLTQRMFGDPLPGRSALSKASGASS